PSSPARPSSPTAARSSGSRGEAGTETALQRPLVTQLRCKPSDQAVELTCAVDERVEVTARGVLDVFPRFQRDLVQGKLVNPVAQAVRAVGEVAAQPLQRGRAGRGLVVAATDVLHVLGGQGDDEVGAV